MKQKAILDELNRKMEEAYEGMKLVFGEAFEYGERLEIPPNVELLNSLNKRATDAQKEVNRLGKQRLEAYSNWADCLHAHISN